MVCNRKSWLNAMSKVMNVGLEHEDAPVLNKYSISEFKQMLLPFPRYAYSEHSPWKLACITERRCIISLRGFRAAEGWCAHSAGT
jgi:hypothetical protein